MSARRRFHGFASCSRPVWKARANALFVSCQCYSGIDPVTESSGNSEWVHFRFACPKFLRQTFHEFAGCSIQWSDWAKAYYRHLREEGKSHQAAVRSLAFKWIRTIFRCWKDGKPYNEEIYMQSLRRRGSLLVGASGVTTSAKWKTVAGSKSFLKITLDGLAQKTPLRQRSKCR